MRPSDTETHAADASTDSAGHAMLEPEPGREKRTLRHVADLPRTGEAVRPRLPEMVRHA